MKVKTKIRRAFLKFLEKDRFLLTSKANERSITHRFAIYVERQFPGYNVDCEFNRKGLEIKKLDSFRQVVGSDETEGVTVYPDIIVHHRNSPNNLVVIEAKLSSNNGKCEKPQISGIPNRCRCDRCKLRAYKNDLGYVHAFYVVFPVGGELENFSDAEFEKFIMEI